MYDRICESNESVSSITVSLCRQIYETKTSVGSGVCVCVCVHTFLLYFFVIFCFPSISYISRCSRDVAVKMITARLA